MRYRWKLLLMLLVVSLGPLLIMRTLSMGTVHEVREALVARTSENLVSVAKKRLQLIADAYSLLLWQAREKTETALFAQANRIESLLGGDLPPSNDSDIELQGGDPQVNDSMPSPFHFRAGRSGKIRFLSVSYASPAFAQAPGARAGETESDRNRLVAMTPTFVALSKRLREIAIWQSVILENGLYCLYPGSDQLPAGFDPRRQPWYRDALEAQGAQWSAPFVDPATRQVVLAVSRPIRRPDGSTAGITSIIVPVSALLDHPLLAKNIPPATRAFLCYLSDSSPTGGPGAYILARDEYTDLKHRSWQAQIEPQWLLSSDSEALGRILRDIDNERGNMQQLPFEGIDSIWVYGEARYRSFFLLVMPYEQIVAPIRSSAQGVQGIIDGMVRLTGAWLGGAVILIFILAFTFSRTVTRPVWALVEGFRQLAEGNFETRAEIRSSDEFGVMGDVFNSIGPQLKERQMMRQALDVAEEVQRSLLPKTTPLVSGLDISARWIYCDQTGGDYFDFIPVHRGGGEKLGVVIGDVTGHGISSALLMTTVRALIRQRAALPGTISQVVADANLRLAEDVSDSGRFATLFYSEIDPEKKTIQWVRAGHDPACLIDIQTGAVEFLSGKGLPLGVLENVEYEVLERGLSPGQLLVLGTDGIWETRNADGEMFGKDRFLQVIGENANRPAEAVADAVVQTVNSFRGSLKQEDDMTLIIIKFTKNG